jgi:hypothetical protein
LNDGSGKTNYPKTIDRGFIVFKNCSISDGTDVREGQGEVWNVDTEHENVRQKMGVLKTLRLRQMPGMVKTVTLKKLVTSIRKLTQQMSFRTCFLMSTFFHMFVIRV